MSLVCILVGAIIKKAFISPGLPPRGGHKCQTRTHKQAVSKNHNKPQKLVTSGCNKS